jgi:hypothetical protein
MTTAAGRRTAILTGTPADARRALRAAARTAHRSHARPAACAWRSGARGCPPAIATSPRATGGEGAPRLPLR